MSQQWFRKTAEGDQGPLTGAQLLALASTGQLMEDDLVRNGPGGRWVPASRIRGLVFVSASAVEDLEKKSVESKRSTTGRIPSTVIVAPVVASDQSNYPGPIVNATTDNSISESFKAMPIRRRAKRTNVLLLCLGVGMGAVFLIAVLVTSTIYFLRVGNPPIAHEVPPQGHELPPKTGNPALSPDRQKSASASVGAAHVNSGNASNTNVPIKNGTPAPTPDRHKIAAASVGATRKNGWNASDFNVPNLFDEMNAKGHKFSDNASEVQRYVSKNSDVVRSKIYKVRESIHRVPGNNKCVWFQATVPIRLYGFDQGSGTYSGCDKVSMMRANLQDVNFLAKDGSLRSCRSREQAAIVERAGGVFYVGENVESQVIIVCHPNEKAVDEIKAENQSNNGLVQGYEMEIVFTGLRFELSSEYGCYRMSALRENDFDSDYLVNWNSSGEWGDPVAPHYIHLSPERPNRVVSADFLAARLIHVESGRSIASVAKNREQ